MPWFWRLKRVSGSGTALLLASTYALAMDIWFQAWPDDWWRALSLAFILGLPVAVGAMTVALSPRARRQSWLYGIFAPWVPCLAVGILTVAFSVELLVCVAIALPIFLPCASIGGLLVTWLSQRSRSLSRSGAGNREVYSLVLILLVAPATLAPLERQLPIVEHNVRVVEAVEIAATPTTIWDLIIAVDDIQPNEHSRSWFQVLGLPRPREATLVQAGEQRARLATYSNGLTLREPIHTWVPGKRLGFTVEVDTVPHRLPVRGMIEGPHLAVNYVEFEISPLRDGTTELQLLTDYTLATPVNTYAQRWIDFLLADFQRYVLDIVRARAQAT